MANPANTYTSGTFVSVMGFNPADGSYSHLENLPSDGVIVGEDPYDGDLWDGCSGDGFTAAGELVAVQLSDVTIMEPSYTGYTLGGYPIFLDSYYGDYCIFNNGEALSGPTVYTPQFSYIAVGALCFLPGTRLATPAGERAIETLAIGDLVSTASGAHKAIKWIGRMTLPLNRFTRATAVPVCVKAGALGNGLPVRDLYVSNDHALAIDGLLVQAGALVDGVNVVRCLDHAGDSIEYFHVELEEHAVILAEGAATESLWADDAIRAKFDNAAEFHARYPQHVTTTALDMPRVKFARQAPKAIRRRLAGIAAA